MEHTVSIVEDNLPFQQALSQIISESESFRLGAVYPTAEAAMALLKSPPDIVIVDIQLPGMSGIELVKKCKPHTPDTQYLMCSMSESDEKIMAALENGASGYILKESSAHQIREALLEIVRGGAPMSSYVARRVVSFFRKPKVNDEVALLSEREKEVIELLSDGLQYKEIAARLFLSTETVKKHLRNVYQKLHVQNKVEAINKFRGQ